MNTPYPELLSDPAAQLAALLHWNAGIDRARTEYGKHPTAVCVEPDCDRLARVITGRGKCPGHQTASITAAARMRVLRAERKGVA